jgi:hypothetical protein
MKICCVNKVISRVPLSGIERSRAVLLVFRGEKKPLLITAGSRDEWDYWAALQSAVGAMCTNTGCPEERKPEDG